MKEIDDEAILVCALADSPMAVPGSIFNHRCSACGRPVMVAPSGQRLLKSIPDVRIICSYCFEINSYDEVRGAASIEELKQEARSAKPNLRRGRN